LPEAEVPLCLETADGKYLFVAARGRNTQLPMEPGASGYNVFAFDVPTLLSASPNDAFLGYGDSGGTAPVGIALFNNDNLLAVANSNRWYYNCECTPPPPPHPACLLPPDFPPCTASVAILDVTNRGLPAIRQIIPNPNNPNSPDFPRNVTVGPDDSTLYVPNANAKTLEVITTSVK
jgi:hypothetical protein